METIYTPAEAAELLKLTAATVRAYLKQGTIKGVRAGRKWRITETALENFMEKGTSNESRY